MPDGGWGRTPAGASDPLITAWVGLAIDYLNPSISDLQVRNQHRSTILD